MNLISISWDCANSNASRAVIIFVMLAIGRLVWLSFSKMIVPLSGAYNIALNAETDGLSPSALEPELAPKDINE